jgi:O-antigen ligase
MINISYLKSSPVVLLFFFLPISTAGSNISLALGVLSSLFFLSLDWKDNKFTYLKKQPFLIYFLFFYYLLVSFLLVGTSSAAISDGVLKYQEIIFMPLLALLISYQKDLTRFAVRAFLVAMGMTLFLSYLRGFGDITLFKYLNLDNLLNRLGDKSNPTIFKWQITHNFLMAFATLLWAYFAIYFWRNRRVLAVILGFICLLGLFNIFFMVQGRVGYLVIFSALLYFFIYKYRMQGFLVGMIVLCFASLFLYNFSDNFYSRINLGVAELLGWNSIIPSNTSVGLRAEFIYQSLKIASEHLFFGVGVGNFGQAYSAHTLGSGFIQSENPHNQYILFLVETGLIGLGAFFYLNYICWNFSKHLSQFWMHATRIVLLSYGIANFFNSFLFDFTESLFFSAFMALAFSELLCEKKKEIVQT